MYLQPYGDEQQLNLNWIINEIINLHKQLDPDYETPSFTQVYPYSNLNRLNLDWVLSELKALKELAPEPTPAIDIQAVAEALVALPFDSNTSYQIYDFISRDGEIWRATEAIAAGGEWDSSKWFKTKIGTDLSVLERWINAINNSLTSLQNTVADLSSTDISDDSNAGGASVKASLNNLKSSVDTLENDLDGLTSTDISDDSDAGGATVKASLNNLKSTVDTLDSDVDNLTSADISDDSAAGGATVKASLNNLKGSLNAITPFDTSPQSGSTKGITSGGVFNALPTAQSENITSQFIFDYDVVLQNQQNVINVSTYGKIALLSIQCWIKGGITSGGGLYIGGLPANYKPKLIARGIFYSNVANTPDAQMITRYGGVDYDNVYPNGYIYINKPFFSSNFFVMATIPYILDN